MTRNIEKIIFKTLNPFENVIVVFFEKLGVKKGE